MRSNLIPACKTSKPRLYKDVILPDGRIIKAIVHNTEDLYLIDTAFESFIDHINSKLNPFDTKSNWDIEITLKIVDRGDEADVDGSEN